jgi:hypothetical protein
MLIYLSTRQAYLWSGFEKRVIDNIEGSFPGGKSYSQPLPSI